MAPMAAMEMEMGSLGGGGKWKTMPVGDSKPLCSARNILCGCGALLLVVLIAIGATLSGAVAAPTSLPSFATPAATAAQTPAPAFTGQSQPQPQPQQPQQPAAKKPVTCLGVACPAGSQPQASPAPAPHTRELFAVAE